MKKYGIQVLVLDPFAPDKLRRTVEQLTILYFISCVYNTVEGGSSVTFYTLVCIRINVGDSAVWGEVSHY